MFVFLRNTLLLSPLFENTLFIQYSLLQLKLLLLLILLLLSLYIDLLHKQCLRQVQFRNVHSAGLLLRRIAGKHIRRTSILIEIRISKLICRLICKLINIWLTQIDLAFRNFRSVICKTIILHHLMMRTILNIRIWIVRRLSKRLQVHFIREYFVAQTQFRKRALVLIFVLKYSFLFWYKWNA